MVVGLPQTFAPSSVGRLQVEFEYQWSVVGESVGVDRVWVNSKRPKAGGRRRIREDVVGL
jgi:hypothetical protein